MGVGLSPLPLAATRLPPPPLADPGLCSVGRRGSLAYGSPPRPPGLVRARRSACGCRACSAAPAPSGPPGLRGPRPGAVRLRGGPRPAPLGPLAALRHRLRGSPRRARLCGRWPGPGLGLLAGLRLGGRGRPPTGPCSARRFPARVSSGPPALRPAPGPLGLCGGLGFSPAAPRPAAPAGGSRGPWARLGGLRPPPAARSAPPEGRASRAPLRHPAPVGAGPRGPLSSPVVNPEIVNLDCYTVRVVPPAGSPIVAPRVKAKPLRGGFASLDPLRYGTFAPAGLTFWPVRGTLDFLGPFRSLRGAAARAVSTVRRKPPPEKSGGGFFMLWAPPSLAGIETLCLAPAALLSLDTRSSDSANATKPLLFCCVGWIQI